MKFVNSLLLSLTLCATVAHAFDAMHAGGRYSQNTTNFLPLLLNKDSISADWIATPAIFNIPSDYVNGNLNSIICQQTNCVGYGAYQKVGSSEYDLNLFFISSTDNGKTYNFSTVLQNAPEKFSFFNDYGAMKCLKQNCFIPGTEQGMPALIVSADQGVTWTFENSFQNVPKIKSGLSSMKKMTCTDTGVCLTSGVYVESESYYRPFSLISRDQGKTWSFKIVSKANLWNLFDNPIACEGDTCIIANSNVGSVKKGQFFFKTSDTGKTWQDVNQIANLPETFQYNFADMNCLNRNCVAVGLYGDYVNSEWMSHTLITVSKDAGDTWQYVDVNNLPAGITKTELSHLKCINNICVAGGSYQYPNEEAKPLLVISQDAGQSWSFIDTESVLPRQLKSGYIRDINCQNNYCVVAGSYSTWGSTPALQPLLMESYDNGVTWKMASLQKTALMQAGSISSLANSGSEAISDTHAKLNTKLKQKT